MKIVKLKGGLGNQMFQYAFALLLHRETGEEIKLDMSTYSTLLGDPIRKPRILKFNISLGIATPVEISDKCLFPRVGNMKAWTYKLGVALDGMLNNNYFFERNRAYRELKDLKTYGYFDGYWQSWKYINEIWDILKQEFRPNYLLNETTMNYMDKVKKENSVFIGVRKGDYALHAEHYGNFGSEYFSKAMKYIQERVENSVFYIFSNDIQWVKNNLDFTKRNVVYREESEIIDDFEDLMIMSSCKHSIIINSTFHWWGARLQDNNDKIVIAPKRWFFDNSPIDIVPPRWIRIIE